MQSARIHIPKSTRNKNASERGGNFNINGQPGVGRKGGRKAKIEVMNLQSGRKQA
jgi:hypothetical protein